MKYKKTYLRLWICFLLCLTPSVGIARTAKAIFLGANRDSPQKAYLMTGKEQVKIDLPRRYLSQEVKVPKGELSLAISPNPSAPGAEIGSAAKVHIPEDCERAILLFMPSDEGSALPFRVVFLDASPEKLPLGHTLIFNLSGGQIAAKIGDQEIFLKPDKSKLVRPPKVSTDNPIFESTFVIRYKGEQEWRVISRASQRHYPNVRQLLFAVKTPGRKYPRMWGVVDAPSSSESL